MSQDLPVVSFMDDVSVKHREKNPSREDLVLCFSRLCEDEDILVENTQVSLFSGFKTSREVSPTRG